MKEILIYGALVAAVISASIPMITNFVTASSGQSTAINGAITTSGTNLVTAINGFDTTGGGGAGGGDSTAGGNT